MERIYEKHVQAFHEVKELRDNGSQLHLAGCLLTLLHSERPKLYTILALLSAIGLSRIQN